jgi:5-methylcytosine-specific restriction protein A
VRTRFCPAHAKAYDAQRPTSTERGYDAEHRVWRAAVLARCGHRCVDCGAVDDLHADHIDPNGPRYDVANGQTLCRGCHSRKTATIDGGFGNAKR